MYRYKIGAAEFLVAFAAYTPFLQFVELVLIPQLQEGINT